ncbi:TetR/AcrR family transcriptional regulator [Brachybacterium sp. DNPG3]
MRGRQPLNLARIIDAAVAVADRGGVSAVSMRSVGREAGVEAMSLYHHVADKEALLDALTDQVFAQIALPDSGRPWRESISSHARSVRQVLTAHPWALNLVETRSSPGPAVLRRHDAVIGCLRRSGFSVLLTAHAISVIDAYVFGFALTERNLPFDAATGASDFADEIAVDEDRYPHLAELVRVQIRSTDYSFAAEFDVGLGIVLDELERRLAAEQD